MAHDDLIGGSVILYPYLWTRQADQGETVGRKERETVIATRFRIQEEDRLALLPITTQPPATDICAYELPALEVQRIARGAPRRLWVILDEFNTDRVAGSFYLTPDCKRGQLSRAAHRALYDAFSESRAARVPHGPNQIAN
jgi:hypothetical protein